MALVLGFIVEAFPDALSAIHGPRIAGEIEQFVVNNRRGVAIALESVVVLIMIFAIPAAGLANSRYHRKLRSQCCCDPTEFEPAEPPSQPGE